jgi:uncharacterized protein (TIGR02246 family)
MAFMMMLAPALIAAAPADPVRAIDTAMNASAAGWNANDLDRFVAIYAPDATYVTKEGLVRGRPAIANRYRPSFVPGGNKRGRLSFQPLAHRLLDAKHMIYWARWMLSPTRPGAKPEMGMTTLVFERRPEGWKIISDHSS